MTVEVALLSRDVKEANLTVLRDWMWGAKGESRNRSRFLVWHPSDLGATAGAQKRQVCRGQQVPLGCERSVCAQRQQNRFRSPGRVLGLEVNSHFLGKESKP